MAQVLVGHDVSGSIRKFDRDGDLSGGEKMKSVMFMNFSRLLVKDEIKKGSFQCSLHVSGAHSAPQHDITLYDSNAQNDYRTNSPAGEYGILYVGSGSTTTPETGTGVGLIYYQAGIAVITSSVWHLYHPQDKGEM